MTTPPTFAATDDDLTADMAQLCRLAGVDARWLQQRMADGLITASASRVSGEVRVDAFVLRRVQRMVRLERDFDAVPELAALVADLEEEVRALRARLQRLQP